MAYRMNSSGIWYRIPDRTDQLAEQLRTQQTALGTLGSGGDDGSLAGELAELRRAVQLFAASLTDEAQMLSVASVYPAWEPGRIYAVSEILRYGVNTVGDPQLWQVLQTHTSQPDWLPGTVDNLYKAVGISESGVPLWVQPLGASDAYQTGDMISYNGQIYTSTIDNNVWSPEAYPAGWTLSA